MNEQRINEWTMYQRMTPFAMKFLRMNPIIVLMVMNDRTEAHIACTVVYSVFSNKK